MSNLINLLDFGARPDGQTLCTTAIQAAIDRIHELGGGCLRIPAGRYLTGTIRLRSHVHLVLEPGASLIGSHCLPDYASDIVGCIEAPSFNRCLIYAENATEIGITGPGSIDGRGDKQTFPPSGDPRHVPERPMLIRLVDCENVSFEKVRLLNAASWCCHLVGCLDVWITDTTVDTCLNQNNDGFDLDGCRNVFIRNCKITSGDDSICLKSTRPEPTENVVISGCVITSHTAGIKLGTSSAAGFRNVLVDQCIFQHCRMGVLKLLSVDGGVLEDVHFSNLVMDDVEGPIFLRLGRRGVVFDRPKEIVYDLNEVKDAAPLREGILRNCSFRNIRAVVRTEDKARAGILLTGVPGASIENILFENIDIRLPGGGSKDDAARILPEDERRYPEQFFFGVPPSSGAFLRHARDLTFRNVRFTLESPDHRTLIIQDDTESVVFEQTAWRTTPEGKFTPVEAAPGV